MKLFKAWMVEDVSLKVTELELLRLQTHEDFSTTFGNN